MRISTLALSISVIFSMCSMDAARAATIADFQFDGSSFASTDGGTKWTTGDITTKEPNDTQADDAEIPLQLNTSSGAGNPEPTLEITFGDIENQTTSSVTLAETVALDNYYTFTVTPSIDSKLSFQQLSFDVRKTGSATVFVSAFASDTGFNAADVLDTATQTTANSFTNFVLDVSDVTDITDPVEFRLYLYRNQASVMSNTFRIDNILLTGDREFSQFVPEPNSGVLLAFGTLGMMRLRRRRRLVNA